MVDETLSFSEDFIEMAHLFNGDIKILKINDQSMMRHTAKINNKFLFLFSLNLLSQYPFSSLPSLLTLPTPTTHHSKSYLHIQ